MDIVSKYLDGDIFAKDQLIDKIMDLHNYNLSKQEAEILLEKKYGKAQVL